MNANRPKIVIAALSLLSCVIHSDCYADGLTLTLRNTMKASVTIEYVSNEYANLTAPAGIELRQGQSVELWADSSLDPQSVKVFPHDEAGTVAPFQLNLYQLAHHCKRMAG